MKFFSYFTKGKKSILELKISTGIFEFLSHTINDIYQTFAALLISISINMLGHYITANYYDLNPTLGFSKKGIFILTNVAPRYIEETVINAGIIANILAVFILVIIFYFIEKKCTKHHFTCFFTNLIILANLLIALVSLSLFPFKLIL